MGMSEEIYLLRCIITKVCSDFFKAKDYNGKKYIILKTDRIKDYKKGIDFTFYAKREERGIILKRNIYIPLTQEEYEQNIS